MGKLKIAVVGCGSVTKFFHLPAIVRSNEVELVALVDKSLTRARELAAEQCSAEPAILDDYRQIFGKAEAAIVAVPNFLHAQVAVDLLDHGLHVLVEKPMALNSGDCELIEAAATRNNRVLALGMARRFCDSYKFVKQVLQQRLLGNIKRFDVREGWIFNWQAASDALFRKETAGGGVLLDIGVHVFDLLLWWFGDCELMGYSDDSEGGLESNCEIRLRFQGGVPGVVELSRTRKLRNAFIIEGERGTLTIDAGFASGASLSLTGENNALSGRVTSSNDSDDALHLAFYNQLEDFVRATRNGSAPFVPGSEGKRAIQLIEACYARREPLSTWETREERREQLTSDQRLKLSGKRVLVTGGTGFIGGRLIERLILDCNAQVRVLVRDYSHTLRVGRFPLEVVQGNITEPADVLRAAEGCDAIFHCAWQHTGTEEEQRRAIVEGTRNVLEAATQLKVRRVVHMSTLMVYGIPKDGDLDESAARQPIGFVYSDSKIEAEKLAFEYHKKRGVPVAILQPTTVYGPYSTWYTIAPLDSLKSSGIILIEDGQGLCNPVYLDDVVSAMILAATEDSAVGEAFLISGERPTTWREFYNRYESMLGQSGVINMSAKEALKYHRDRRRGRRLLPETIAILRDDYSIRERILGSPEMRFCINTARLLLPRSMFDAGKRRVTRAEAAAGARRSMPALKRKPPTPVDPPMIPFLAAKVSVRIDKAKRMLGYEPRFDLRKGMERTERWARWANLIP